MANGAEQLLTLIRELEFSVAGPDSAVGEVQGLPTSLTLLGDDPPAVIFGFRVRPDASVTEPLAALVQQLPPELATLSVENGCVWLSLYNLNALPDGVVRALPEQIGAVVQSAGMALPAGCLRCGSPTESAPLLAGGQPTRLCAACQSELVQDQAAAEEELNRPTLSATLGVPGATVYVALGWIVVWTVVDFVLDWWGVKVIEINHFTALFGIGLFVCAGYALGWPLGATIRHSIGLRRVPWIATPLLTLGAVIVGEIGYLALRIFLLAGVFDFGAAVRLLGPAVGQYTGFWIFCKLAQGAAIAGAAVQSTMERRRVTIDA
jgi:hypothetical protein